MTLLLQSRKHFVWNVISQSEGCIIYLICCCSTERCSRHFLSFFVLLTGYCSLRKSDSSITVWQHHIMNNANASVLTFGITCYGTMFHTSVLLPLSCLLRMISSKCSSADCSVYMSRMAAMSQAAKTGEAIQNLQLYSQGSPI
jgi:hypothetical protein